MYDSRDMELVGRTLASATDGSHSLAHAYYARLFELKPDLRAILSGDLEARIPRFMGLLHSIPLALEMPDEMSRELRAMGLEHHGLGIGTEHYDTMQEALLHALAVTAGPKWSDDARAAWSRFFEAVRLEFLAGRPDTEGSAAA